ncbi:MAG: right-handed parallel beta-helix repeat-containing protein [Bacteroidota bacterium]
MKRLATILLIIIFTMTVVMNYNLKANAANDPELKWQSVAFGQSTDLNFSSTITPAKVGVNGAIPEVPGTIEGKIIVESRGGKIAAAHDGIAFYYTVIDPRKNNFLLEADILVEQFGPETDVMPNSQTACGLMVRDINGAPRRDPMVFGFEELPVASNMAAVGVFSNKKTVVTAYGVSRKGIKYPWGNPGSVLTRRPLKFDLPVGKPFKLKLERTDTGFIMTYADIDGGNSQSVTTGDAADIVQVCEKDKMYVGFFAARNAKMVVSNAKLTLSPANTQPGEPHQVSPFPQSFEIESSNGSSSGKYTLMARSAYDGFVLIKKDGVVLVAKDTIKAGEFYQLPTTLAGVDTKFELTFFPTKGPTSDSITKKIAVEKRSFSKPKELVAAPSGKPTGSGRADDPLDLATALKFVQPGGTILLRGGNYGVCAIPRIYSSVPGKLKKLAPYKDEKVIFNGVFSQASYWHFYGLESTASGSFGFRIQGNGNLIERCVAHHNLNTGFQLDPFTKTPVLKCSDNLFLNCDAYDNTDPTMENADGFASKSCIGKGNAYRGCIAHHNADDGWDLFNNVQDGPNEPVLIENCIAYQNGFLTNGKTAGGAIGNGFKLGGEAQPVAHIITNSIAFGNRMDGFTCNFNPGALRVKNCTAFDNARFNYIFRSNHYIAPSGTFRNNLSFRTGNGITIKDFTTGIVLENNLFYNGPDDDRVKESDFLSLKIPVSYQRDRKGQVIWGDFLRLTKASPLNRAGTNGTYLGALAGGK